VAENEELFAKTFAKLLNFVDASDFPTDVCEEYIRYLIQND